MCMDEKLAVVCTHIIDSRHAVEMRNVCMIDDLYGNVSSKLEQKQTISDQLNDTIAYCPI